MLENLKHHLFPTSIEEVLELLKDPANMILAGGTGISLERNAVVESLIDLRNVGLSFIKEEDDHFKIGAMTPAYDIYKHEGLSESLKHAAYCTGDTPLMHAITIGGNLAKFYNWVDLPPVLWAIGSIIEVYDPDRKIMNIDEFMEYSKVKQVYVRKGLITEIQVPKLRLESFDEFQSFMTSENEKAQLNLASYFEWDSSQTLTTVKLVLSASTSFPERLTGIEEQLIGKKIEDINGEDFMDYDFSAVPFLTSYKSSVDFRTQILRVYVKRTIQNCQAAIGGNQS